MENTLTPHKMATKIEGYAYDSEYDERGELTLYEDPLGKEEEPSEVHATIIIHDGPPEKVYTESEVEAERKSNRELVQALVDALAIANTKLPVRSALPTGVFTDIGYVCASVDAALSLASSKGYTPTPA